MKMLNKKDEAFREQALYGNMWKLLLAVGLPLAMYQSLTGLFKILDSLMASYISAESVSTVVFLSQLQQMFTALGTGLAAGGSMKISEAYGAGDTELVRKRVSSLYAICLVLCALDLMLIPFSRQIMLLAHTPEALLKEGQAYFNVELLSVGFNFFNTVYIAIERTRGHSKKILNLNLGMTFIKLGLTAFFVYVLKSTVVMIGVASLISQIFVTVFAVLSMREKDTAFGLDFKSVTTEKRVVQPIISISFPVIVEKITFAFGKVVVNSMSSIYGALTVGALGISNNISGLTNNARSGMQDGAASVISQNLGAGNLKRIEEAFWKLLVLNLGIGVIGFGLSYIFIEQLSGLFAMSHSGYNAEFQQMIVRIFTYEMSGSAIPLAFNATAMALLLGVGYTKLTLVINFLRIFLFRIPVLWALQHFTDLGSESAGVIMFTSNLCTGLLSLAIALAVLYHMRKHGINGCTYENSGRQPSV